MGNLTYVMFEGFYLDGRKNLKIGSKWDKQRNTRKVKLLMLLKRSNETQFNQLQLFNVVSTTTV